MKSQAARIAGPSKPFGYRPVLTFANAKTSKGEKLGYLTGICYLAPGNESGVMEVCQFRTAGCSTGCLFKAGRAQFTPSIIAARIAKTVRLHEDRELFLACLRYDIASAVRKARRMRLQLAIRVNGTSDLAWMGIQMATEFPRVQFYDYTKLPSAWLRVRSNYHLTFSHSESNLAECERALSHGLNVAVVFDVQRGKELPTTFLGRPVVDGDLHDLRFLNGYQGAIIGLRAKGPAKRDCTGFVVKTQTLVQIQPAA